MALALGRLLDQAPGARNGLPHLTALERALKRQGTPALDRVPEKWLIRLCAQLANLPVDGDDAALNELLAQLSRRLHGQAVVAQHDWEPSTNAVGFDPLRTVVISEVSHDEFLEVTKEVATTLRMPLGEG